MKEDGALEYIENGCEEEASYVDVPEDEFVDGA